MKEGDKVSYLVAYMLTDNIDKYDLHPERSAHRDHFVIFDGEDYVEALKFYDELVANVTTYSANLCEILISTEAYSGVHYEKTRRNSSSTKESVV